MTTYRMLIEGEEDMVAAALALDQSKNPHDHVTARAIRQIAMPMMNFLDTELRRAKNADDAAAVVENITNMTASVLVSMCASITSPERVTEMLGFTLAEVTRQVARNCAAMEEHEQKKKA
jgi:uncharacterized protein (UPF0218 family)